MISRCRNEGRRDTDKNGDNHAFNYTIYIIYIGRGAWAAEKGRKNVKKVQKSTCNILESAL